MLKQEEEGALEVVIIHLRNVPFKVSEEFETSVIDRSQSFNGNWYESVRLRSYLSLLLLPTREAVW